MNSKKRLSFIILIGCIAAYAIIKSSESYKEEKIQRAAALAEQSAAAATYAYVIDEDYRKNPVRAGLRYRDHATKIAGVVTKIEDKGLFSAPYIQLAGAKDGTFSIEDKDQISRLATIDPGDHVTIVCDSVGYGINAVVAEKCIFLDPIR